MKKIIIDGLYRNNIRFAILNDNKLEDFSFDTNDKHTLRGNIYLGKVSRVENSLQAAFVDYGGEKNGFLSFSEIHPDNFQIPKEDKEKFMKEMSLLHEKDDDDNTKNVEAKLNSLYKSYNIGEVIKKDQLVLVQVIKEERGNKGASLTTYLTFPGRYFALMTNTPKKIGISKKILNIQERGRIREIVNSFGISKSAGIVVRTIAENQDKEELLKDYNYLASLWNSVREKTVKSQAPAFIHSEEGVVKKILRDYCDQNTQEILVEGEEVFNELKSVAKSLGVDKSIKITNYSNKTPIFVKSGVENEINELFVPKVKMPSGAYLIIQQTEALVSIDVNSGKVTSASSIEETAVQTNLEAAKEIARQLKLRKLSGLIVIDFIDMANVQNRILVENEVKQSFVNDKFRVHVGRISQFGLLEISRQRADQSIHEASTITCKHCEGAGMVKSPEYSSMNILTGVASSLATTKAKIGRVVAIYLQDAFAIHIMNFKQEFLSLLQKQYNTKIVFLMDNTIKNEGFKIEYSYEIEIQSEEDAYSKSLIQNRALAEDKTKTTFFAKLFNRK